MVRTFISHAYKAELEHKVREQQELLESLEAQREGQKTVEAAEKVGGLWTTLAL